MNATASASAFSSPEATALERQVDAADGEVAPPLEQVWNDTHRKVCTGWIRQNGYKHVCLQFPDNYLPYSNAISDSLKSLLMSAGSNTDLKIFILADTSYGSCCVDEVAAAHVEGDSIIHFGNACRSKVSRLPVLYMFPEMPLDMERFVARLTESEEMMRDKTVFVYLDIGYHYLLEQHVNEADEACLSRRIKEALPCKELFVEVYPTAADDGKIERETPDDRVCLFVGADNNRFFNLSLTTKAAKWFIYDASTNTMMEKNPLITNFIRRRYYYIEKCKDAQTLGLIVATLSADGYLDVISRLQEMAKSRGIKTQLISVGRINPAKLANFLEIDCFVLIGCPFNNAYNSKEFYKPLVSVFEAEMALNPAWYMKYPETYVTDFKELLPEGRSFLPFEAENVNQHDVSLVSGRLRNAVIDNKVEAGELSALSEQQRALVSQGKMEIMTTNTGLTYEDRTWKGLDPALGRTEPAKLEKGLSGIPIKYTHD